MKQHNRFIGAILILAGTCIGAGMLAIPISTAPTGFVIGIIALLLTWGLMYTTGLLVLETNLWFNEEVNYISMAEKTLGKVAKWLTWLFFLLLLYALITAYIMGGSQILAAGSKEFLHIHLSHLSSILIWAVIFAVIIYLGTVSVDTINKILMLGLIIAFVVLAAAVTPNMHLALHGHDHPIYLIAALPILITSFGYHIVVPSMTHYLNRNTRKLRWVILLGSLLPLVVYLIWEYLIFATVPVSGPHGLIAILHSGAAASGLTLALSKINHNPWLGIAARSFAFFALASSFLGVALGLFDLLADGTGIKKSVTGKFWVALLTFVPPLIFAYFDAHGFLLALSYAGAFVAIIHGILPAAMVWAGRKRYATAKSYRVWIGRFGLSIVILLSLFVICAQVASNWNFIP